MQLSSLCLHDKFWLINNNITSPEPEDKLQMGYKSIMRTDQWVSRPTLDV